MLDLTGRQRCQWGQVLRQLETADHFTARPPRPCLALLQRCGAAWCHDASPVAMGGGSLCPDPQDRLLGCLRPMSLGPGRGLALLRS